ncbi:hypothetical protein DITRI_Ditri12bG0171700 [Diplodiscus trichospermus]
MATDAETPNPNPNKLCWGDQIEGEENAFTHSLFPLLPRQVGIKMSMEAMERRSSAKFGDTMNEEVGSRLTMVSTRKV